MTDIIRDAWLGQIVRFLSKNRLLKYAEEQDGFTWPPYVSCAIISVLPESRLTGQGSYQARKAGDKHTPY